MRKFLLSLMVWLALAPYAQALQFELAAEGAESLEIVARGPIVPGDVERLRVLVDRVPARTPIIGLRIASPGGNVVEAETLAAAVRAARLPVTVPSGGECASACFLVFAAARERHVGVSARIGVHSASMQGRETATAMAITTAVARRANEYGVPPDIIGKMVITGPRQMTWLSAAELAAMGALPDR